MHFLFLTASSAQMAQREEFMFQNVAYRPTVYRTGKMAKSDLLAFYTKLNNLALSLTPKSFVKLYTKITSISEMVWFHCEVLSWTEMKNFATFNVMIIIPRFKIAFLHSYNEPIHVKGFHIFEFKQSYVFHSFVY